MKNISENIANLRVASTVFTVAAVLTLGACASGGSEAETATAPAPAADAPTPATPSAFGSGAPAPRFSVPSAASQSAPSVNTVPTAAPAPSSTQEERDEARKGLIADLANSRHSEFGGRTQPVVVRPYVATANDQSTAPAPDAPDAPAASRLDEPAPARPAGAGGAPAKPAAGPAPANKIPTGS